MAEVAEKPKQKMSIQERFLKRQPVTEDTDNKVWEFELIHSYPNYKPVEKNTGKAMESPYPKTWGIPNDGVAFDEKTGKARAWRLIEGQDSIWVDEQKGLENLEKTEIHNLVGQPENQLEFKNGKLLIRGIQKNRLQAVMIQDAFEGKTKQYKVVPRVYRLNNPDLLVTGGIDNIELKFAAMQKAMACTTEEMVQAAWVMGIDVTDLSDAGLKRVRLAFYQKAEYDPKNPKGVEFFLSVLGNPATATGYIFSQGLSQGFISANQQPGKLTWAKTGTAIMDINPSGNVVDQLIRAVEDGDKNAIKVKEELENQIG